MSTNHILNGQAYRDMCSGGLTIYTGVVGRVHLHDCLHIMHLTVASAVCSSLQRFVDCQGRLVDSLTGFYQVNVHCMHGTSFNGLDSFQHRQGSILCYSQGTLISLWTLIYVVMGAVHALLQSWQLIGEANTGTTAQSRTLAGRNELCLCSHKHERCVWC